jgi:hypothetical protein
MDWALCISSESPDEGPSREMGATRRVLSHEERRDALWPDLRLGFIWGKGVCWTVAIHHHIPHCRWQKLSLQRADDPHGAVSRASPSRRSANNEVVQHSPRRRGSKGRITDCCQPYPNACAPWGRGGLSWDLCSPRGEGGYTVASRVRRTRFKAYMLIRVRSGVPRPAKLYSRV